MKLSSYLTFLLLLIAILSKAQKPDTAQAIVHYKFTHVRDTNNRDKPLVENMILLVGRNSSVYKSYDRKLKEEQMRKSIEEQMSSGLRDLKITSNAGALGPNVDYYQYPNEKKLYTIERLMMNSYVIPESMAALNWKISADTATIGGLPCQKATTRFKGRNYTAWFCDDLPYRSGPWKLSGLPGLIVEASDDKKEVMFKFDGIEKISGTGKDQAAQNQSTTTRVMFSGMDDASKNSNVIALPTNSIKTNQKEFEEVREIMRKDPQAFAQSQRAAVQGRIGASGQASSFSVGTGGGATAVSSIGSIRVESAPGTKAVTNNPIELPEKK
ncbi:GLPGLI family protein [Mucilaginibacter sp. CSA2-8R]|uniref:GLPGLI family protein n=1 Tax=Mucilaginibacter sp. CSA2-8R TaxID=3141542 RepID=UPI00315DFC70